MAKITKDINQKLGEEAIEEIIEKDWKIAEPPSEEELAQEKHESSKARNNPNSRKNLAQYNKKSKETKRKIVKNLQYSENYEDIDPKDILGDEVDISALESIMPARKVLADRAEQEVYYNVIKLFLKDFVLSELTFSDIDDIVTLAINKVLEQRLLALGRSNPIRVLEAAPTLEKFRKHSDKIKSNLANRRVDRIDVRNKPTISIVDLVAAVDNKKQAEFDKRVEQLKEEEETYVPPKRDVDDG